MRIVLMIVGLFLVVMAGLWFFTPVLDQTYARHAPGISHSRGAQRASVGTSSTQNGAVRQQPSASRSSSASTSSSSVIGSKDIVDNVMSMINAGTGLLGLWFGWMSYRLQLRDSRRT